MGTELSQRLHPIRIIRSFPNLWMVLLDSSLNVLNTSVFCRSVVNDSVLELVLRVCPNFWILSFVLDLQVLLSVVPLALGSRFRMDVPLFRDLFSRCLIVAALLCHVVLARLHSTQSGEAVAG